MGIVGEGGLQVQQITLTCYRFFEHVKLYKKGVSLSVQCVPIICPKKKEKAEANVTVDFWGGERNEVTGSYMQITVGNLGLRGSEMSVIPLL